MHRYVYGHKNNSKAKLLSIFFHQTDQEAQKIIGYGAVIGAQTMAIILLLLVNSYLNIPVYSIESDSLNPVGQVAGVQTEVTPTVSSTPQVSATTDTIPSKSEENIQIILPAPSKKHYTIAVYGDSMVDTMGEVLEYLDSALHKKYPDTEFLLYNYGKGSENVEMGLNRFHNRLDYQNRSYPPITDIDADIIILGSFAYNPFTPHNRDHHWLTLTNLVQEAQKTGAQVYMLAEIAPLRADFGKGPNGVNWETKTVIEHSGWIIEQLENAIGLSQTLHVPLIDAYTSSLVEGKKEGRRELINPSDNIHPSVEGHTFMAEKIAETIVLR